LEEFYKLVSKLAFFRAGAPFAVYVVDRVFAWIAILGVDLDNN